MSEALLIEQIAKESKEKLKKGNRKEMTDVIYDTLVGNTQFPQFDYAKTTPISDRCYETHSEVDGMIGMIRFGYMGHEYKLTCELVK